MIEERWIRVAACGNVPARGSAGATVTIHDPPLTFDEAEGRRRGGWVGCGNSGTGAARGEQDYRDGGPGREPEQS